MLPVGESLFAKVQLCRVGFLGDANASQSKELFFLLSDGIPSGDLYFSFAKFYFYCFNHIIKVI